MEKVQDPENTIDIFENDIQMYLTMFCEENGIEGMKKESQSVWNGALRYIRRHVFSNKDVLKSKDNINIYNNNIPSTFNAYNYDTVNYICDIYIDLCFINDKEVSIIGFSNLTGINTELIYNWANENTKLSTTSFNVYKKLSQFREESLSNKLVTGNKNPVGVIAVLNRQYGWASPYTSDSNKQRKSISAEEIRQLLPKTGDSSSNCTMIESVQDATDHAKEPKNIENKG